MVNVYLHHTTKAETFSKHPDHKQVLGLTQDLGIPSFDTTIELQQFDGVHFLLLCPFYLLPGMNQSRPKTSY
jgi:hypothetical protein